MLVFVINKHGEPLMPCKPQKARKLLKQQKAKIIKRQPFTIQLIYGSSGYTQDVTLGIDTGATHVGIAATTNDNHTVLFKGEVEFRTDIKSLLDTRRVYRMSRRSRKTRYRQPRFLNRKRKDGWLPPSLQNRINHTIQKIDLFKSLLPNPKLIIEVGHFDMYRMQYPDAEGLDYQKGPEYGYYNTRHYVFTRDKYTCQLCKVKNQIFYTHHLVYRSHGGTDRASNLITLCGKCHSSDNHKPGMPLYQWMLNRKKVRNYKAPAIMNIMKRRLFTHYPDTDFVYGSSTKPHRKQLGLAKSHANDAIAITRIPRIDRNKSDPHQFKFKQFRKKKRSLHEATARKGRTVKNTTSRRNAKNTKSLKGFNLNDTVFAFGERGFISGFTGTSNCYVKSISGQYIYDKSKNYKQIRLSKLIAPLRHNNNWQYQIT